MQIKYLSYVLEIEKMSHVLEIEKIISCFRNWKNIYVMVKNIIKNIARDRDYK